MAAASTRPRRPLGAPAILFSLVALVVLPLVGCSHIPTAPETLPCHAVAGTEDYALDLEQAANATTIAAVGKRLGLPDHAVTVALAAALQESKLYNLSYGDRDSVGLFQQRPSQGWGTHDQILSPRYAATAFFSHLTKVANWESLPVTDAVQAVQISAGPDAYARWEAEARVLAQALTGEVPAAFTCRTPGKPPTPAQASAQNAAMVAALIADAGAPGVGTPLSEPQGWLVAGWLIAHAPHYAVATVAFGGQRWSGKTGKWTAYPPASNTVEVNR